MFVLFRILPTGEPARLRAGRNASPKVIADLRVDLGLNKSLPAQFWIYMKERLPALQPRLQLLHSSAPVRGLIAERLGATHLADDRGGGDLAGDRPAGRDRLRAAPALAGSTARAWAPRWCSSRRPEYWLGLIALYLFAADIGKVKIFPGAGSYVSLTSDPWKWFTSLLLPWLVLAAGSAAIYARLMRGSLTETMQEDYIRTARAKGLSERRVVLRHGVRAAINPILTILALDIATLLGGGDPRRSRVQHPRDRPACLHRDHGTRTSRSCRGRSCWARCSSSWRTSSWTSPMRISIPG